MKPPAYWNPGDPVGFIICLPVGADPVNVVEGSTIRGCSRCPRQVYIAPSSVGVERQTGAPLLCTDCALTLVHLHERRN